ncbi:MAG: hypothetical protein H8E98_02645 [Bacteroidetes bacterium]|nr:hypothetical protein [Bacteroidota bacterium]
MNNKDKWLYQVFWGDGYTNTDSFGKVTHDHCKMSICWLEFFTEENGYSENEINTIKKLELGASIMLLESGTQSIVRMR